MNTIEKEIITRLESHIVSECTVVDREERFNNMLDDCYSFESIGGPFANMSPSRVLLEVDPVAHRCGVNDWADGKSFVEVNGDCYEQDEAEKAKEEFVAELEEEKEKLESEVEEMVSDNTGGAFEETESDEVKEIKTKIALLEQQIDACNSHSF